MDASKMMKTGWMLAVVCVATLAACQTTPSDEPAKATAALKPTKGNKT